MTLGEYVRTPYGINASMFPLFFSIRRWEERLIVRGGGGRMLFYLEVGVNGVFPEKSSGNFSFKIGISKQP